MKRSDDPWAVEPAAIAMLCILIGIIIVGAAGVWNLIFN